MSRPADRGDSHNGCANANEAAVEAEKLLRRTLAGNEAAGYLTTDVRLNNVLYALGELLAAKAGLEMVAATVATEGRGSEGKATKIASEATHAEAIALLRRAFEGRASGLGADHPDTLKTKAKLERAIGGSQRAPATVKPGVDEAQKGNDRQLLKGLAVVAGVAAFAAILALKLARPTRPR